MSYQYATSYSTSKDEGRLNNMWQRLLRQSQYDAKGKPRTRLAIVRRRLLTLPAAIFALWFFVLLWGERSVFHSSIDACKWDQWEKWVCLANGPYPSLANLNVHVALRCTTSPHCTDRRPSARRSAHLSRSSMAALLVDHHCHR